MDEIYKLYEGSDEQCDIVQHNRELLWVKDVGASGALRYMDNDGVVTYIYPYINDLDLTHIFDGLNTGIITESGNLYYTDERVDLRISNMMGVPYGIVPLNDSGLIPYQYIPPISGSVSLVNYYTKKNLQTPGQSYVHWDNIINAPVTDLPSNEGAEGYLYTDISGILSWKDISTSDNSEPYLGLPAVSGYILSSSNTGVRSWVPAYTHPVYQTINLSLSGNMVLSSIVVDSLGHITTLSGRTISYNDISAQKHNSKLDSLSNLNSTSGFIYQNGTNTFTKYQFGGTGTSNFISRSDHTHTGDYEPILTSGTIAQYFRGDKTWQTLNTSNVPEGSNLYFTSSRVISTLSGAISTALTSNLTSSRVIVSNSSGKLTTSSITSTQLSYLSGVLSPIQAQLDLKQDHSNILDGIVNLNTSTGFVYKSDANSFITYNFGGNGVSSDISRSDHNHSGTYEPVITGTANRILKIQSDGTGVTESIIRDNGTTATINGAMSISGNIIGTGSANLTVSMNATNKQLLLTGGTSAVQSSGAIIKLYGITESTNAGRLYLGAGTGKEIVLNADAVSLSKSYFGTRPVKDYYDLAIGNHTFWDNSNYLNIIDNAYYDGGWKYRTTRGAARIAIGSNGNINLMVASEGTADSALTWKTAIYSANTGNVAIGHTSPTENLDVSGNIKLSGTLNVGSIPAYSSSATTYLTSNSGIISSRTAAQVRSDIGAQTAIAGTANRILKVQSDGTGVTESSISDNGTIVDFTNTGSTLFKSYLYIGGLPTSVNSLFTGNNYALIYSTGTNTGSYPFNNYGHLIIQAQSTQPRSILFVAGTTPEVKMRINPNNVVVNNPLSVDGNINVGGLTASRIVETDATKTLVSVAKNTAYNKNFGTTSGTVCQGNDSRLSDARTPTSHASTHLSGGSDQLFDQNLNTTNAPLFTGGSYRTNSGSNPLYITRIGTNTESMAMWVDDVIGHVYRTNDEFSGKFRITIENTDTEDSDGSRANTAYWDFTSDNTSSNLTLTRGANTYTYWHSGNFDPSTKADSNHNHDSRYARLNLGTATTIEQNRDVLATGIYSYIVKSTTINRPSGLSYGSSITWGTGATGSAQLLIGWTSSDQNYIAFRSLRNTTDNWWNFKRIYHEGYKPSPADIGAAASTHSHTSTELPSNVVYTDTTQTISGAKTFSNNVIVGSTSTASNRVVRVLTNDSYNAGFEAYGSNQGTGYLFVGQGSTYGGGIFYNGDGSPSFASGEIADRICFYRMNSSSKSVVFYYPHNSNDVYFNGNLILNSDSNGFKLSQGQLITNGAHYSSVNFAFTGSTTGENIQLQTDNGYQRVLANAGLGYGALALGVGNYGNQLVVYSSEIQSNIPLIANSTFTCSGSAVFSSNLAVSGSAVFSSNVTVYGTLDVEDIYCVGIQTMHTVGNTNIRATGAVNLQWYDTTGIANARVSAHSGGTTLYGNTKVDISNWKEFRISNASTQMLVNADGANFYKKCTIDSSDAEVFKICNGANTYLSVTSSAINVEHPLVFKDAVISGFAEIAAFTGTFNSVKYYSSILITSGPNGAHITLPTTGISDGQIVTFARIPLQHTEWYVNGIALVVGKLYVFQFCANLGQWLVNQ